MKGWLERFGDWLQDYGWVIPAFAMGVPVGLVLADNPNRLEVFSYLGTFGAAIAAFWAVFLNQQAQRKQARQDAEAQRPHLIVSKASHYNSLANITFTNLSQHPVHIRDAVIVSDDEPIPEVITVGLLVPPGNTSTFSKNLRVNFISSGNLRFFFNYAPTGPVLQRVLLPFIAGPRTTQEQSPLRGRYTPMLFITSDQKMTEHAKDESEQVYRLIEEAYMQPDQ